MTSSRRAVWSLAAVVAAVGGLYGSGAAEDLVPSGLLDSPSSSPSSTSSAESVEVTHSKAGRMLTALPVKGRAPMTGYEREKFGQSWSDDVSVSGGHNGCDTRNDVLRRDLTEVTIKPGTEGCVVLRGTLEDPYSGQALPFVRGEGTSNDVPVDHVVALGNAWATGAQQLTPEERENLANDPLNLQPTMQDLNSEKGDSDVASWLPPNKGTRCTYVTRQIMVKTRYDLWVTPPEKDAMNRVLSSCPKEGVTSSAWNVPDTAQG